MSHPRIPRCAFLALLLLAPALTRAADVEKIDNPAYLSWAEHKPGTKTGTEMTINAAGQNMVMKMSHELLSIEKDHALIETVANMSIPGVPAGKGQKQKIKVPAKVAKGQEELPEGTTGTVTMAGNETIEVAGKRYDCKVVDFTGTAQGMKSTGKIWNSVEMPGSMVKMDMNSETPSGPSTMSMKVVSVETK